MKKIVILIGEIFGLGVMFVTVIASITAEIFNMREVNEILAIVPNIDQLSNSDMILLKIVTTLDKYSHWIITGGIIWLILMRFIRHVNKNKIIENKENI